MVLNRKIEYFCPIYKFVGLLQHFHQYCPWLIHGGLTAAMTEFTLDGSPGLLFILLLFLSDPFYSLNWGVHICPVCCDLKFSAHILIHIIVELHCVLVRTIRNAGRKKQIHQDRHG